MNLSLQIPKQFRIIHTSKKRIIIFFGGRGGGKTVNIAIVLLLKSLEKRLRIFCCREILESIDQSVHATLSKKIRDLGLQEEFDIQRNKIIAKRTGSEFFYGGLFRNVEGRKGLEDVNYVWISEGAVISEESLQILLPSIRANDSQVIIDMNPRYEDDAIYKRYIANPDTELCDLVNINYDQNPYFPDVLEQQRQADQKILPKDEYQHIWHGVLKKSGGFIWTPPFDATVHVKDFLWHKLNNVNLVMAVDPHQHYYPAIGWIAMIKMANGTIYHWVCAEWPTKGFLSDYYSEVRHKIQYRGTLSELSIAIKKIEEGFPVKVLKRFIDSRFAKGVGSAGMWNRTEGMLDQWRKPENGGLHFVMPSEQRIDAQRNHIRELMVYNKNAPLNEINEPTFYVSASCHNVIQSMQNHKLELDSEKEDEKYKDFSDFARICMAGVDKWVWQDPEQTQKRDDYGEWGHLEQSGQATSWQGT
jgi:PBSX family phage terminase large subunit